MSGAMSSTMSNAGDHALQTADTVVPHKINSPLLNEALHRLATTPKDPNKTGRLITIPHHVLEKIDTTAPFALKLNNETFKIDPSRLIMTTTGALLCALCNIYYDYIMSYTFVDG